MFISTVNVLGTIITSITIVIFSYNTTYGQFIAARKINEKFLFQEYYHQVQKDSIRNKSHEPNKVGVKIPLAVGFLSGSLLAIIFKSISKENGKEDWGSPSMDAAVGFIIGFVGGFFISGAILQLLKTKKEKEKSINTKNNIINSLQTTNYVSFQPYVKYTFFKNEAGICLKYHF